MRRLAWPRYPGLFLQMAAGWLLAPLLIRLLPLPALLRVCSPTPVAARDEDRLIRVRRYCEVMTHYLPLGTRQACLRQCLVLFYHLNRWGEPVTIRFGMRQTEARAWIGHCWLTTADGALWQADPRAEDFTEVATFGLGSHPGIRLDPSRLESVQ